MAKLLSFKAVTVMLALLFLILSSSVDQPEASIKAGISLNTHTDSEILVKFKPEAFVKGVLAQEIQDLNGRIIRNNRTLSGVANKPVYTLKLKSGYSVDQALREYKATDLVEYAEPNYLGQIFVTPNDTNFALQYALHNTGQTGGSSDSDIDAPEAWDVSTGSNSIKIAILDTGVDWDHLDLESKISTNISDPWSDPDDPDSGDDIDDDLNNYTDDFKGWDFVDVDDPDYLGWCQDAGDDCEDLDNNPMDFHGHGTHVSGIAGADTDNNAGVAGAGWDISILAVRMAFAADIPGIGTVGVWEVDDAAQAIYYAVDNGADIISASWGTTADSATLRAAINYARDNGVIFVAAAGNTPPTGLDWEYSLYPAIYNGVISVGSTTHTDTRSSFSNYGSWVDTFAPGSSIYSSTYSAADNNDTYGYSSGTSMATPLVAGTSSLLSVHQPTWSYARRYARTRNRADNIDAVNPSYLDKLGSGRINAPKLLSSDNDHTDATLIKTVSNTAIYYLDGNKRKIPNASVFLKTGFRWQDVVIVNTSEMNSYPASSGFMYHDSTLVKGSGTAVYVLEYGTKRHITSANIFNNCGYKWTNIVTVADSMLDRISTSNQLSGCATHPSGSLIKTSSSTAVYLLDNGRKQLIPNATIYRASYEWASIIVISDLEMSGYPTSGNMKIRDGVLIKGSGSAVYVMEYGEKRHITSGSVFSALGYQWKNILILSDAIIDGYPTGPNIS
jgi:subtilisin family serine protease